MKSLERMAGLSATIGRISCLLVLAALPVTAFSQSVSWRDLSGGYSCSPIVKTASGALFAVDWWGDFSSAKLVYSTDGGVSWLDKGISADNIVDLVGNTKNGVLFLDKVDYGPPYTRSFLCSSDNAVSWFSLKTPPSDITPFYPMISDQGGVFALNLDFVRPSVQLVWYDGKNWNLTGKKILEWSLKYASCSAIDHAGNIFVGTIDQGVYCTADKGATWRTTFSDPVRPVTNIYIDGADRIYLGTEPWGDRNGGIFISADTGKTWRTLGLYGRSISGLATDERGIVYASVGYPYRAASGGVYRNVPGTTQWVDIGPSHGSFPSIVCTDSGDIITGEINNTMFRSTDGGATWLNSSVYGRDIFALISDDSGYVYAGTLGGGIYKQVSPGTNRWVETRLGPTCDYVLSFARSGREIFASTECGVFRTSDWGKHWANVSSGSFDYWVYSIAVADDGRLFAGTTCGVFRSGAGDTIWHQAGLRTKKVIGVAAGGQGNIYALSERDGVYLTTDGGKSWTARGLDRSDVLTLAINGSGDLFVGEYGGVSRSTDRGITWKDIPIGPLNVFSIAFRGDFYVYVATTDGVYYSTDGGDTWNLAGSSGMRETFVLSVAFDHGGHLYAGTYRGRAYVGAGIITGVNHGREIPLAAHLEQNYPNPFNPTTTIRFSIPRQSHVSLKVFDVLGRGVATLVNDVKPPGSYAIPWDAKGNSSGLYFYQIVAGPWVETKKMLVIR